MPHGMGRAETCENSQGGAAPGPIPDHCGELPGPGTAPTGGHRGQRSSESRPSDAGTVRESLFTEPVKIQARWLGAKRGAR